ncbi:MAG: hypothetical protein J0H80_00530, partial [Rhizobiales bacterium]|nr:hypothetical protein [Hyphomicrobiales bacterium]
MPDYSDIEMGWKANSLPGCEFSHEYNDPAYGLVKCKVGKVKQIFLLLGDKDDSVQTGDTFTEKGKPSTPIFARGGKGRDQLQGGLGDDYLFGEAGQDIIEGGKGYATVKLSRADADKAIVDKIRDGIIRNISVGYAIHKVVKTDADGDGNDEEWRVVDWEPLEISAVPVPADAGSQIRKDAPTTVPCEFVSETATGRNEARRIRMAMRQRQSVA